MSVYTTSGAWDRSKTSERTIECCVCHTPIHFLLILGDNKCYECWHNAQKPNEKKHLSEAEEIEQINRYKPWDLHK